MHPVANPIGHDRVGASMDDLVIISADTVTSDQGFLNAVRAEYNLPPPPGPPNVAKQWTTYQLHPDWVPGVVDPRQSHLIISIPSY